MSIGWIEQFAEVISIMSHRAGNIYSALVSTVLKLHREFAIPTIAVGVLSEAARRKLDAAKRRGQVENKRDVIDPINWMHSEIGDRTNMIYATAV